ncbi:Mlc1 [Cordylochernes scorpioides]|uniref:Mlc1 n=1 Tax=Cordylochernes scorpioides TaxID=51811 RepID=A0ABY6KPP6_9ARAC|nr:Mlc1 [Cordylochernes scorpioides]
MGDVTCAEARMHFDVYDFDGTGKVDAGAVGDIIRSMDIPIENEHVKKHGGTLKKGEKKITLEEFLPILSGCKKEKDLGTLADLMEGLKVYDKNENGTMMLAELVHICLSMGTLYLF